MSGFREFVDAGGLLSFGANLPDQFRRAAEYVDKILRGAKPGENLKTAKALGLKISDNLLSLADEVIE
jgi:putative tryptophan/tyrosine transport system substrate-binding protein